MTKRTAWLTSRGLSVTPIVLLNCGQAVLRVWVKASVAPLGAPCSTTVMLLLGSVAVGLVSAMRESFHVVMEPRKTLPVRPCLVRA